MKLLDKLISFLLIVPMVGCAQTPISLSSELNAEAVGVKNNNEELYVGSNQNGKANQLEMIRPKTILKIDPTVRLIAPPTNLPNQMYEIPEVEEKENYIPPVSKYKIKKIIKKDKYGHKYVVEVKELVKDKYVEKVNATNKNIKINAKDIKNTDVKAKSINVLQKNKKQAIETHVQVKKIEKKLNEKNVKRKQKQPIKKIK